MFIPTTPASAFFSRFCLFLTLLGPVSISLSRSFSDSAFPFPSLPPTIEHSVPRKEGFAVSASDARNSPSHSLHLFHAPFLLYLRLGLSSHPTTTTTPRQARREEEQGSGWTGSAWMWDCLSLWREGQSSDGS